MTQKFSFEEFATHLKQVRDKNLPAMENSMLQITGVEAVEEAKERIIGRITPLGAMPPFNAWPRLRQSTIDQKAEKGQGKDGNPASMLWATGEMQASVKYKVQKGLKMLTVFSDCEWAVYMEYGFVHWRSGKFIGPRASLGPALLKTVNRNYPKWEKWFYNALRGLRL